MSLEPLPLLSKGRHRNPRKGACFMELASYLAGERWSDHPACTHPLLAGLARLVNDHTTNAHRSELAVLVPSIIGIRGEDLRLDATIALRCATTALPVAACERQLALAVSVLAAEEMLARLEERGLELSAQSAAAFEQVPRAAKAARAFSRAARMSTKGFRRFAAPNAVQLAVVAIAQACVDAPDAILRELLVAAIADSRALVETAAPEPARVILV